MKTTLTDLNEYLFEQLERITNDDLSEEELEKEMKRSDSVQKIAKTIIDNGQLALQAKKHLDEYGNGDNVALPLLGYTDESLSKKNNELVETVRNLQKRVKKAESWEKE